MADNIEEFPAQMRPELLIGPFKVWKVQVDGRIIPRLTGYYEGDRICLIVDGRFGATFSREDAYAAAALIAHALAIGAGYSHSSADSKDHPFAPIGMAIGEPHA